MKHSLYLGGAPGFKPSDIILPHPTKHLDGCAWCASGNDDNHLPDRVFATPVRLYAKYYASKYVLGWLYIVDLEGDVTLSDKDSFETYHAPSARVVSVSERAVELTPSERRRLYRRWITADEAKGVGPNFLVDRHIKRMLGISA